MRNCHDLFTRCEAVTVISDHQPQNRVGTARCAVRAACSGATIPPAVSRAGTSQRDVPTWFRVRVLSALELRLWLRLALPSSSVVSILTALLNRGLADLSHVWCHPTAEEAFLIKRENLVTDRLPYVSD